MIGTILKRMRNIYGYKAYEMGEKLEISNSYLSEIENNKKQPSLELLEKYSEVFGVKVSSIFLLAERYEEKNASNKGNQLIRTMMVNLIKIMSSDLEKE